MFSLLVFTLFGASFIDCYEFGNNSARLGRVLDLDCENFHALTSNADIENEIPYEAIIMLPEQSRVIGYGLVMNVNWMLTSLKTSLVADPFLSALRVYQKQFDPNQIDQVNTRHVLTTFSTGSGYNGATEGVALYKVCPKFIQDVFVPYPAPSDAAYNIGDLIYIMVLNGGYGANEYFCNEIVDPSACAFDSSFDASTHYCIEDKSTAGNEVTVDNGEIDAAAFALWNGFFYGFPLRFSGTVTSIFRAEAFHQYVNDMILN